MTSQTLNRAELLDLPQELLTKIASYLDIRSAISLSTTCRDLQQAAESRVWREIHIRQKDILGLSSDSRTVPSIESSFVPETEEENPSSSEVSFDNLANTHFKVWALRSHGLIFHLIHLLESQPWRKKFVKVLNLELRNEIPKDLMELLRSLPSLKELAMGYPEMSPLPPSSPDHDNQEFISRLQLFQSLQQTPLTQLKKVKISIITDWSDTVHSIINSAPNLEYLHIGGNLLYTRSIKTPNSALCDFKDYLKLKELTIEGMHPSMVPIFEDIVNVSPDLRKVALRDQALLWRPEIDDSLLGKLAKLERLKQLEVSSNCFDSFSHLDGWEAVEDLRVIWSCVRLKEMEDSTLVVPPCIIPPLPNLKRYQIEISIYSTIHYAFGQLTEPHLSVISILLAGLPKSLDNAPNLSIIHCPKYQIPPDALAASKEQDPWDYNNDVFQGLVLYSFTNDRGDELIHCRTKIQHPSNNATTRPRWMGNSAGWEEYGFYNRKSVPTRVLAGVYGITGMTLDGIQPGRNLEMDQRGWDLLRTWEGQDESWS